MEYAPTLGTCALRFQPSGGIYIYPLKHSEEGRLKARVNPEVYPPGYDMKVAVQEFANCASPKSTSSMVDIQPLQTFQLWLKDINVHVQDQNLTEREAIQLVKDFTAERARDEVEFYMGV